MTERLCPECRIGAHDHCACECDVCAHRYDHVLLAKLAELVQQARDETQKACRERYFQDLEREKAETYEIANRRAEKAEARLAKAMAALREMRTTYVENRHAREWARFLETALECCGLCGQEIDSRFPHECPAHYVDFSAKVTYSGKAK